LHASSFELMNELMQKHVPMNEPLNVLDVGSLNVHPKRTHNTTYRVLMRPGWYYTGMDLSAGPNVDYVARAPYDWAISSQTIDVVISGQCLEHVEAPWKWMPEVVRVLKPGGLAIIIAPWSWGVHRRPVDCWRVLPDGLTFLFVENAMKVLECGIRIRDCYGVARK